MIFILKGATFPSTIGTVEGGVNQYIGQVGSGGATYYTITYKYINESGVTIKTDTTAQKAEGTVLTFATSGAPYISGYEAKSVSPTSLTVTGDATVTYTYKVSENTGGSGGESGEPETPVNPTPGGTTTPNTVTWELGAINSGGGPNSTDMPTKRIRTAGYLQVESSITIKATGNVEFCPVYYRADKTYISSPNKYQTTDCVVNASEYPLVRLMIRDKTSTSADLSSKVTELGNSIVITGNFVEIPYGSGEEPDEPETPTRNIPPLADTATWYVGALNSNGGDIVASMTTRLYSNRFALTSSPMTITVSGDAEICPVWYKSDGSFQSSPAVYQTTPITTTSADGHSVAFMIRNKSNTSATLTTSFGSNVTISK